MGKLIFTRLLDWNQPSAHDNSRVQKDGFVAHPDKDITEGTDPAFKLVSEALTPLFENVKNRSYMISAKLSNCQVGCINIQAIPTLLRIYIHIIYSFYYVR